MIRHAAFLAAFAASSIVISTFSEPGRAAGWDDVNSPNRLERDFVTSFDVFPLSATVPTQRLPWADTYWPSNRGGIAYRWNSRDPLFQWSDPHFRASDALFRYRSPTRSDVMRMSRQELEQLSPAEKFDIIRGKYEYPLTRRVLKENSPGDAYWEGICHGWAPASVNHPEPLPVDVPNPDGKMIPFGSADVKAILDYYYATVNPSVRQMGKNCAGFALFGSSEKACNDVNPGSFHIALANYVGLRGRAIVADVSGDREMWNNAIYAYATRVEAYSRVTASSSSRAARRVLVSTTVRYPSDDQRLPPQWEATVGKAHIEVPEDEKAVLNLADFSDKYRYESATYRYWLELDAAGRIVGGEWVGKDHPDYLWIKAPMAFTGEFSELNRIYRLMGR